MYLFLVGGCRASWWGSQGYKSVRREVTSSDRKQVVTSSDRKRWSYPQTGSRWSEGILVPSSLLYTQSRAFTPRKGCPHLGRWVLPPQLHLFPSQA